MSLIKWQPYKYDFISVRKQAQQDTIFSEKNEKKGMMKFDIVNRLIHIL